MCMVNRKIKKVTTSFSWRITLYSILSYFVILMLHYVVFMQYDLPIVYALGGGCTVMFFFIMVSVYVNRWKFMSVSVFQKKLFWASLLWHLFFILFLYFLFDYLNGYPFEFSARDSETYHRLATETARSWEAGRSDSDIIDFGISDRGFSYYLSIIYYILECDHYTDWGWRLLFARSLNALWWGWGALKIYRIAKWNFGEQVGRIAGIMTMFLPSILYYCGLSLKEAVMTFLIVWFIEQTEIILRSKHVRLINVLIVIAIIFSLFTFRTIIGCTAVISLGLTIMFFKNRFLIGSKRFIIACLFVGSGLIIVSDTLLNEVEKYYAQRQFNQEASMSFMKERGHKLSQYGSAVVFAPIILIAPFPTLVYIPDQKNIMMQNGSFFVRNIYAFFAILSLWYLIKKRLWRKHVLLLSTLFIYLGILSLSGFAISPRFHVPILPILTIFSALGIYSHYKKSKMYFIVYMIFLCVVIIGWNWFKLAGRGWNI